MTTCFNFPSPLRHELTQEQWEEILTWCAEQQASDIVLCPDDKIWMQKDGVWFAVTDSCITDAEIQYMVNVTSGQSNRAGYVRAGHSLDYAFGLRVPGQRGVRQRFRVNATSSNKGIYVVLRILPRTIPVLEDMQLPDDLVQNLYPEAGLVVISGVMGSGKSTLLAAVLNRALLPSGPARQILTLEDPIEFDFSSIPCQERVAPITQSAIGTDVEDWAGGVRTLTRRKGEIVMVGECRDRETISSLLSTVEQGVTAYTTVHAQDVPQTLTRIIHLFRKEERDSAMAVLFANIRLIIHQRLVPRKRTEDLGTGRIALREYLACDRAIRTLLYELDTARLIEGVRSLVGTYGHSLLQDAKEKHARGLIDDDVLLGIVREQEGRKPACPSPSFWPSSGPSFGPSFGPYSVPPSGPSRKSSPGSSQMASHLSFQAAYPGHSQMAASRPSPVAFQRPSSMPSSMPLSRPSSMPSASSSASPSYPLSNHPSLHPSQDPVSNHFTGHFSGHFTGHIPGYSQGPSQGHSQEHIQGRFPGPAQTSGQTSARPSAQASIRTSAKPSAQASAQASARAPASHPVRQQMASSSAGPSASSTPASSALASSSLTGPAGPVPKAAPRTSQAVPAAHDTPVPAVPVLTIPVLTVPVPEGPLSAGSVSEGPVPAGPVLTGPVLPGLSIQPLPPQSDSGSGSPATAATCPRPQSGSFPGWPGSPAGCTA